MDLKIKCDGKEYDIPELTVEQWLKIITAYDKYVEKLSNASLFDPRGVESTLEFYHLLLHDAYPELTRQKLKKMPFYQLGVDFSGRVITQLTKVPFDFEPLASEGERV